MSTTVKCLIVDDEPLAIALIKAHIEQVPQLELVAACQNALAAFEILKSQKIDLLFLDIQMPVLTGIEFVKSLKEPPAVIFTTAHRQYALEGYELNVVDYLLKPIPFTRFFKAINKFLDSRTPSTVISQEASQVPKYIFVNVNKKNLRLAFADILYIESLKDYLKIITTSQSIVTKGTISAFAERLPDNFCRVHRSYIVNVDHIKEVEGNMVRLDTHQLTISKRSREAFLAYLAEKGIV